MEKSYREDEFVLKWLLGLEERTKENYLQGIKGWIDFVGMTPTEQIEKRVDDLTSKDLTQRRRFDNLFLAYKEHLEKTTTLKPSAIKSQLIPVASFFSRVLGRNTGGLGLKSGNWESKQTREIEPKVKVTKEGVKAKEEYFKKHGYISLKDAF